jgi:anti-anti-sigma factor
VVPLQVEIVSTPVATLVTVVGEVDIATIARFRESLGVIRGRDTVVEMSDVGLLSAVGVRVLLDLQERLADVGARLVLAAPSRPVRRVLGVLELDGRLPIVPTFVEALTLLNAGTMQQVSSPFER